MFIRERAMEADARRSVDLDICRVEQWIWHGLALCSCGAGLVFRAGLIPAPNSDIVLNLDGLCPLGSLQGVEFLAL